MRTPRPKAGITRSFFRYTGLSVFLVALLAAVLFVMALLQYRWSGQVSEAEHERMHASLLTALNQFQAQFQNELHRIDFLFQPDVTILNREDWQTYALTCENLLSGSDLHLVRNVWLWISDENGDSRLLVLNRGAKKFGTASWPPGFEPVRIRHSRNFLEPVQPGRGGVRPTDRFVNLQIPLMLHPLIRFQPSAERPMPQFLGFLMLELNRTAIEEELFPELARKSFGTPEGFVYHIAVVRRQVPPVLVYTSDPGLTPDFFANPDARIYLLENRRENFGPGNPGPPQRPISGREPIPEVERPMPGRRGPPPPDAAFRSGPGAMSFLERDGAPTEVLAKHSAGSLDAAVAKSRRRNLAISFGSLLLLAISMALILVFSRRAQRLAKLQIDFVAGVSHELRTPLAVICSAGDNLADGVVGNSEASARKYGELVRSEGRKLSAMVEQILKFASLQSDRYLYSLSDADVNGIVSKALSQAKSAIDTCGFSVETSLDPDLPPAHVDSAVLSHAIQNLIQNALKYSGENRWMMIRTEKVRLRTRIEVRISVEDKGLGIDSEDLGHIFEPFYRGTAALKAQIHGTGLGLFMVQEAVQSMAGRITVRSARGKGSIFTIHLPASQGATASSAPVAAKGNHTDAV